VRRISSNIRRWRASGSIGGAGRSGSATPRKSKTTGRASSKARSSRRSRPAIFSRDRGAVGGRDAVVVAEQLEDGQQGDALPVRHPGRPVGHDAARPAALEELEAEAALPDARVGHHPDHLAVALERAGERGLERRHLIDAADEAGEPSHA